jgi:enoyl-CoA hydratase/carnithine racemase
MSLLLFEIRDRIASLTLNNPQKRNALSREMLQALHDQFEKLQHDQQAQVVILKANGTVFSAGHDLKELVAANGTECSTLFALCSQVMTGIRKLPQPVIAQVHGLATAAGCQLVASCDLVVASEGAKFATPGVKIGLFCTTPGVALARAVPIKKAMEMLLTGEPISAQEAERIGLVNRVVPAERLEAETLALAEQIRKTSSSVVALGKRAFYEQLPLDLVSAYKSSEGVMVKNAAEPDAREGMQAFLEKRQPKWQSS